MRRSLFSASESVRTRRDAVDHAVDLDLAHKPLWKRLLLGVVGLPTVFAPYLDTWVSPDTQTVQHQQHPQDRFDRPQARGTGK